MINSSDIIVRLATRQDAVPVTKLLRNVGLIQPEDEDIESHWDRLWKNNPFYKDFPSGPNYGWVMEYNKQIVGYAGSFPRTCYFNRQPIQVCIASQWGVEKEYRNFSLSLCGKFFSENPIGFKLNTTAQHAAGMIFEKLGRGKKVPSGNLKDIYMIPFKLSRIVKYESGKKLGKYKFFSPFLSLLSTMIPLNIKFKFTKQDANLQEVNVKNLPKEFETFWENYLKNYDGFIASRSTEVIEWYYSDGFRKLDKKVFIYTQAGQIAGYGSIVEEPVPNSNLKRYKIADLLANTSEVKHKLLKGLLKKAYTLNADLAEVHVPGMIERKEIPAFTIKRQIPNWPCYYQTPDKALEEKLQNPANWNISSYDGDSCLF